MKLRCPKCQTPSPLHASSAEGRPLLYRCAPCGGGFLTAKAFQDWARQQTSDAASQLPTEQALEGADCDAIDALVCPDCSRIMLKYPVSNDMEFRLDYCRNCCGVWLDRSEWEALASRGLHRTLSLVFSEKWQSRLSREASSRRLEAAFAARLGEDAYQRVRDFAVWLEASEFRSEVLAYLQPKR